MNEVRFKVQGSATEPYDVVFNKTGNNLTAHCTCPAGEMRQHCKHRIHILLGDTEGIVSQNKNDIAIVLSWLPGSDVEVCLKEFNEAEQAQNAAKKRLEVAKKKLAKALTD
ncbi:MAG: hypothetical protein A2283_24170 [Lentisphaerae bacterium RIFOXYA12_FULL_48_11]|nr:MAG: hypothetical protein A2283_24170 [Lentisphaerae bacterium RIFOXYA12_FULL_48_11]